jgi:hypothetical protein
MPTTPSPERPKRYSVIAIQRLLNTLYLGKKWTDKEYHIAQMEVNKLISEGIATTRDEDVVE